MKKVIISAIIGALFGGVVVFATTKTSVSQQNQMIANAKGLPETPKNKVTVIENKSTDNSDEYVCNPNKVLDKNKKFYFKDENSLTILDIKKRTISTLEFELTYKNEKLKTPFILNGVAEGYQSCETDLEPFYLDDDEEEDGYIYQYAYRKNDKNDDCYISINKTDDSDNINVLTIDVGECKKIEKTGFKGAFIATTQYE